MANFQVLDAYGSVITIQSSTFSGAERQIVGGNFNISGNPSISGTVNVGNVPSVNATVVNIPSVNAIVTNVPSVNATIVGNPSISGTVQIGNPISSVFVVGNPSISGTVNVGNIPSVTAVITNTPSVNALITNAPSIYGNISGSVVAFQGTNPWVIGSIVGTYTEDAGHTSADKGIFTLGVRNDNVASFVSADLDYTPIGVDSAGRSITKPYAAEESRIEGIAVLTSTSVTTMVAAAGAGLKNYVTDIMIANTGSVTTLVTFKDGAGSILGYTIAPATGGSNAVGLATPMRTGVNATFDILPASPTSTLYATVKGYKAP